MLKSLHIENIAIIERSCIEFFEGLNVLSGETGAGKSIIIDSINAVLGQRVTRDVVRQGATKANVIAEFADIGRAALEKLRELELPAEQPLVISRAISADGKSSCRIAGRPVSMSTLNELGSLLVNIHGQHDSQSLLNPDTHCSYLDELAGNDELREAYRTEFERYVALRREQNRLKKAEQDKQSRMEMLEFQIKELAEAEMNPGESGQIKERLNICRNAETLKRVLEEVSAALTKDDDGQGALPLIKAGASALEKQSRIDPELQAIAGRLEETAYELEAIAAALENKLFDIGGDSDELERLETRADRLYRLSKKYGGDEEHMLGELARLEAEYEGIQQGSARLFELDGLLSKSGQQLLEVGERLSQSREAAAGELERRVAEELGFLDMPGVAFKAEITKGGLKPTGAEAVQFLISANPGSAPKPLSKIASGGELSRIMLAIKGVLSEADNVDTLIFDEIDNGISGRAAGKVGLKLREQSGRRQVLCVTHLAQIAAAADHQYLIEKTTDGQTTTTGVTHLDKDGRVKEIARIMGGLNVTETTLQSARELLSSGTRL